MAINVEYIVSLKDKFTPTIERINRNTSKLTEKFNRINRNVHKAFNSGLVSKFKASISKTTQTVGRLNERLKQTHSNLGSIIAIGATIGGAFMFGKDTLKAWDTQMQAVAQVKAGLESTGHAAGLSLKQLEEYASFLQKHSLYGDEEILKNVTAQLLTFTDIRKDVFKQAEQAIIDISARLGQDLKSSAIQVGKALNDPIQGVSALSRVGIQFTDSQKQMIKYLVETGRKAEAQKIILAELNKEFGGSAEAMAKAGLGPLKQLEMRWGDLKEVIGGVLYKAIKKLLPLMDALMTKLENAMNWLTENADKIFEFAQALAIGVTALKSFTIAQKLFNLVLKASPIMLTVSAVSGLVLMIIRLYKSNEKVREAFSNLFKTLKSIGLAVFEKFKNIFQGVIALFSKTGKSKGFIDMLISGINWLNNTILKLWNNFKIGEFINLAFAYLVDIIKNDVIPIFHSLWGIFKAIWKVVAPIFSNLWDIIKKSIPVVMFLGKIIFGVIDYLIRGVKWFLNSGIGRFLMNAIFVPLKLIVSVIRGIIDGLYKVTKWAAKILKIKLPKLELPTVGGTTMTTTNLTSETQTTTETTPAKPLSPLSPGGGSESKTPTAISSSGGGILKITIEKLIEQFIINTSNIEQSQEEIRNMVAAALIEGLNEVELTLKR